MDPKQQKELVLPDANVWIASKLLTSDDTSALLFQVQQVAGRIVLPMVVRMEVESVYFDHSKKWAKHSAKGNRNLTRLIGASTGFRAPTDEQIHKGIRDRFARLGALLDAAEIDLAHVQSSLQRMIKRVRAIKTFVKEYDARNFDATTRGDQVRPVSRCYGVNAHDSISVRGQGHAQNERSNLTPIGTGHRLAQSSRS